MSSMLDASEGKAGILGDLTDNATILGKDECVRQRMAYMQSISRSAGRLVGRVVARSVGRSGCPSQAIGRPVGWTVCRSIGRSDGRSVGWSVRQARSGDRPLSRGQAGAWSVSLALATARAVRGKASVLGTSKDNSQVSWAGFNKNAVHHSQICMSVYIYEYILLSFSLC